MLARRAAFVLRAALAMAAVLPPASASDQPLPGFARRIAGDVLDYHSADPDIGRGLLVRSLDADRSIVWETAPVPADFAGDAATFVWLFGLDVDPGQRRFELRVDGEPWLTFRNPPTSARRELRCDGPDGAELHLRATVVDRFDDLLGYATLRVPRARLTPGAPLRLEVAGETAGDRAWYITFMAAVAPGARLAASPAIRRDPAGGYRPLDLTVVHLDPPCTVAIETSHGASVGGVLQLGANRFELRCPPDAPDARVRVRAGDHTLYELATTLSPLRRWSVDLVQHTHTDIGYTRRQSEILPEQLRFIDRALDLCDRTDALPEPARFRWTCEVSHAVRDFVRIRPAWQVERLRRRVAEGRIEVTGMLLNMSDLVDEASFAAFLRPIAELRDAGLRVTTAMQNDVNGAAWCLVDHFAELGIEALTMGQNGHRALIPFDVPTCFWWESKAGRRVLVFRADHYMTGNFLGVHTGNIESVEPELLRYLRQLEDRGYGFDRIAIQHSGSPTDNAPPSVAASAVVTAWNERYEWPRLRCSTAREFVSWAAATHGDALPTFRRAWPDWWTDGFGSAARETAAARVTQARMVAADGLLAMAARLGTPLPPALTSLADACREDLLLYAEHTFGAADSIREPWSAEQLDQWGQKAAYAWDAVKRAALLTDGALSLLPVATARATEPRIAVVNPLAFERAGLVELCADHAILPIDRPFRVLDDAGGEVPVQRLRTREGSSDWTLSAPAIPPLGWRTFRVAVEPDALPAPLASRRAGTVVENAHYRVEVDPRTGAIASWRDRATGRELVDRDAPFGFGLPIHEALGDREQLEALHLVDVQRATPGAVVVDGIIDGPVFTTLALRAELPGCATPSGVRWELRLFHAEKRLELHYAIAKRRGPKPDGLYVAFPFALPDAALAYEAQGGEVDPRHDILPGAAADWQAVQDFVALRARDAQVVLSSAEIPLVQLGGIRLGEFRRTVQIDRSHVYGWVMNDYWTTNFLAGQEGEFRFAYALTSGAGLGAAAAARFGRAHRIPLVACALAGGGTATTCERLSLLPWPLPDGLHPIAVRPADGGGLLLHLRELDGRSAHWPASAAELADAPVRLSATDLLGRVREPLAEPLELAPFAQRCVVLAPR
ncbi:MAG: hypothetical protein IPM29_19150 [Planctomycetes bacterium]|nr:hypothetical protein [Planctomycetota bacterium]